MSANDQRKRQSVTDDMARRHTDYTVIEQQGDVLTWKEHRLTGATVPTSKRGIISGFTKASRFRLLKTMGTLDWQRASPSLFVTLTYPDEIGEAVPKLTNQHRWIWWRYAEKYLDREISGIWRIEWKHRLSGKRKGDLMPHFHLMIFNVAYIPMDEVNVWWKKSLGVDTYVRTEVKRMESERQTGYYVAKYCGKVEAESSSLVNVAYLSSGRHWGIHRKSLLPRHAKRQIVLVDGALRDIAKARASASWKEIRESNDASFTLLGPVARIVAKIIWENSVDEPKKRS